MRYLNVRTVGFLIQRRRYASDKFQNYHLQTVLLMVEIGDLFFRVLYVLRQTTLTLTFVISHFVTQPLYYIAKHMS